MNSYAKLAIAAAAVVAVAVVGINLLPTSSGVGGGPAASPSPSSSAPVSEPPSQSEMPSLRPEPSPIAGAFLDAGALAPGRFAMSQNGVEYTLELSEPGWSSAGLAAPPDGGSLLKNMRGADNGIWILFWTIDGVYSDPCGNVPGPRLSPSAADLADAVATLPGTELVDGPSDVTVGGRPAKHVAITIPESIDCPPDRFFLWYDDVRCGPDDPCSRWASQIGEINRVWIIEVNGTHIWIEAETYPGAGPEVEQEIQQIIDSIRFE